MRGDNENVFLRYMGILEIGAKEIDRSCDFTRRGFGDFRTERICRILDGHMDRNSM